METVPAWWKLWQDVVRVDRSQAVFWPALRNAVGVFIPLAIGAATGQLLLGLTASTGALQVAFADRPGPYRLRAGRMLLACLAGALSVFVGAATGTVDWLAVVLAALWGLAAGLLVALGQAATQIGLTGIIVLLIYGAHPLAPGLAAGQALLFLAGGLLQTLLSVAVWPVRRYRPEREALAAVFRKLAAYVQAPSGRDTAPPVTAEITAAATILLGLGNDHGATAESLRALLDEAERIRLELLVLHGARKHLHATGADPPARQALDTIWDATGRVLTTLAEMVATDRPLESDPDALRRIETTLAALRQAPLDEAGNQEGLRRAGILSHSAALAGQLHAAVEIVQEGSAAGEAGILRGAAARPAALRPRGALAILRANLNIDSAAFRHAIRLAVCLGVAAAVARGLALPRGYWLPMTAALTLRPDFTTTVTRGIGRMAGTLLGLVLATGLVHQVFGALPAQILLAGGLVFFARSLALVNFGLSIIPVTGLVVLLTGFAGANPQATILERGLYTLGGGLLGLAAYRLWPTWERTQTPAILADLLDSYRRYFAVVLAGYLNPDQVNPPRVQAARLAARLARSNAEASVDRLRTEAATSPRDSELAAGVLANSHRFAYAVMAVEAELYHRPEAPRPATLQPFVADVDTTLAAIAGALRDSGELPADLPDLRTDQSTLVAAAPSTAGTQAESSYQMAVLTAQTERITNSLNTILHLLRYPAAGTAPAPAPPAPQPERHPG
jgi:uncharacterized membrane protein YccC